MQGVLLLGLARTSIASSASIVDLSGTWQLSNSSMPSPISATVPGQVHTDLLKHGVIADPFNSTNPDLLRWVALVDWSYSRTIDVPAEFLKHSTVQLVSLGIDTVADIYINGRHVLYTDNMFHRIRLDVHQYLVVGTNTIRVDFVSKVLEAAKRAKACNVSTSITCPSGARNSVQHGFDNQNYLRTEPCSFSWDWGPGFAPVGLWRPIYLQAYDTAIVRDITVVTTPHKRTPSALSTPLFDVNDLSAEAVINRAFSRTDHSINTNTWDAAVSVFLDAGVSDAGSSSSGHTVTSRVLVSFEGMAAVTSLPITLARGTETSVSVALNNLTSIKPWMPNGFGSQQLYITSAVFVHTCPSPIRLSKNEY